MPTKELLELVEAMERAEIRWLKDYNQWCEDGKGRMPVQQEYRARVALDAIHHMKQIADDAIVSWNIESKISNKLALETDALREALESVVSLVKPTTPEECDAIAQAKALL